MSFWPIGPLFFSNETSMVLSKRKPGKWCQLCVNWRANYWMKNVDKHIKRTGVTWRTILSQNYLRTIHVRCEINSWIVHFLPFRSVALLLFMCSCLYMKTFRHVLCVGILLLLSLLPEKWFLISFQNPVNIPVVSETSSCGSDSEDQIPVNTPDTRCWQTFIASLFSDTYFSMFVDTVYIV